MQKLLYTTLGGKDGQSRAGGAKEGQRMAGGMEKGHRNAKEVEVGLLKGMRRK